MAKDKKPALVDFYAGYGESYQVEVAYISEYPRNSNGACSFCDGDPCNEYPKKGSLISKFYKKNKDAPTCPLCQGRPT